MLPWLREQLKNLAKYLLKINLLWMCEYKIPIKMFGKSIGLGLSLRPFKQLLVNNCVGGAGSGMAPCCIFHRCWLNARSSLRSALAE